MPSPVALISVPQILLGKPGHVAVVSLAATIVFSSGIRPPIINHEALQVLALTIGSILAVAVVAGVLICIPDFVNGTHRSRHRRRGRARHRTRHGQNSNGNGDGNGSGDVNVNGSGNQFRRSSRSRERLNQNDYPHPSSTVKSYSSNTTATSSSRKETPSMPPLPTTPRTNNSSSNNNRNSNRNSNSNSGSSQPPRTNTNDVTANFKTTPGRVPVSIDSQRRNSSPPCLPSQAASLSQYCLNPIVERKLEDLLDYDDYWWRELDSRTQYYALILGYTQVTWDDDFELDDLPCEDWDWDEMTKEQKAAAHHFGYDEATWTD